MSSRFDGIGGIVGAWLMARMNVDMEKAAIAMTEPRDGERFVVVGFGPGIGLLALLDAVTPSCVVALDPSGAMVRAARRRLSRHGRAGDVQLVKAPATGAPASRDFDAVVAVNTQQFWDPHRDSVRSISDALRAGGRLVTLTHRWAIAKHHATIVEWKVLVEADLEASGFDPPEWSEARYRSGAALGLRAYKSISGDVAAKQ